MICYGKSIKSIAEDLNVSEEKATQIYNAVLTGIPGLKHFMEESQEMARQLGYVETNWGRRRHIPDMQLPKFEITTQGTKNFDPFFDSEELGVIDDTERLKRKYLEDISKAKYKQQKDKIKMAAEKDGFKIKDNTKKIEDATRQCVNCVDDKTEILTKEGWKTVYELKNTDTVYSYNMEKQIGEWTPIQAINKYEGNFDVYSIKHPSFNAVCTPKHKWIQNRNKNVKPQLKTTEQFTYCDVNEAFPLLRVSSCSTQDASYEDWFLELIGRFLTKENVELYNNIDVDQGVDVHLQRKGIINDVLKKGNVPLSSSTLNNQFCSTTSGIAEVTIKSMFPTLTPEFICSLSSRQAKLIIKTMVLQNDLNYGTCNKTIICKTKEKADMFEMLCAMAGIACTCQKVVDVKIKNVYYTIRLLKRRKVRLYKKHFSKTVTNFVWCPTTQNGTWFARRNGETYFTGNSRIQGSASDMCKIAIQTISKDQRLKDNNFKMVLLVHDEIIGECPAVFAKEAAEYFEQDMISAANDLKTGAKVDAVCVLCWYGDEYNPKDITHEKIKELKKEIYGK